MSKWLVTLACFVLGAVVAVGCSVLVADLTGTDDAATQAVERTQDYQPWFESVWEPGSDVAETALFGLQAGLGAGALGWVLVTLRQRRGSGTRPEQAQAG